MAKSSTTKSSKKRLKLKDLPAAKKKLSGKDMKEVKGGAKWEIGEYDAQKVMRH